MIYINLYKLLVLFIFTVLLYNGLSMILDTNNSIINKYTIKRVKRNYGFNDDEFKISVVTIGKTKILGKWTPFGVVMRELDKNLKKKQDIELSNIIIQLQNIAISQQDRPTTLSHMLSSVVRFSNYTKKAFVDMLLHLDQGDEEEARKAFVEEIDTPLGRDLGQILIKLDSINPVEVINQLKTLDERVKNENITNKNQEEEFYSNLLYLIPTALCFVILLNFLKIILSIVTNFSLLY